MNSNIWSIHKECSEQNKNDVTQKNRNSGRATTSLAAGTTASSSSGVELAKDRKGQRTPYSALAALKNITVQSREKKKRHQHAIMCRMICASLLLTGSIPRCAYTSGWTRGYSISSRTSWRIPEIPPRSSYLKCHGTGERQGMASGFIRVTKPVYLCLATLHIASDSFCFQVLKLTTSVFTVV